MELPEVHGSRKGLDPHRIPEKQTQPIARLEVDRKPRIGQGRAGVRRKVLPLLDSRQRTTASKPIVITNEIESKVPRTIIDAPVSGLYPPYLEPSLRPPPKPPDNVTRGREFKN